MICSVSGFRVSARKVAVIQIEQGMTKIRVVNPAPYSWQTERMLLPRSSVSITLVIARPQMK